MAKKRTLTQRVFNDENLFFRIMGVAGDLIMLNIYTVLTSIPLVTMGASLTALGSVLMKMLKGEPYQLTRTYFAEWKRTAKRATGIWLIALVVAAIAGIDVWALSSGLLSEPLVRIPSLAGLFAIVILTTMVVFYALLLLPRSSQALSNLLISAATLGLAHLPRTVLILVILGAFAVVEVWFFLYLVPLILLLGIALPVGVAVWIAYSVVA